MFDSLLIMYGFGKYLSATSTKCSQKMRWLGDHKIHIHQLTSTHFETIIIDDSIVAGLSRYGNVWGTFFKESLNLGIGGDRTQHILWRVERSPVQSHLIYVIIHCGTNNIGKDSPSEIANSILCIALLFKKRNPCLKIIITGIFPRDDKFSRFRIIVPQINQLLKTFTSPNDFIDFLEPTKDWLKYNGDLNNKLFWTDHLHFSKFGNKNLHHQFLHFYNSAKLYQRNHNLFLLAQLFVSL